MTQKLEKLKSMKANTKKIMKSNYDSDDMSMSWRPEQHINSKHTRHSYNRKFKKKWRDEIKRQAEEEIKDSEQDRG